MAAIADFPVFGNISYRKSSERARLYRLTATPTS